RRIRVEDLHARIPEDVAREPLVAADRGVEERHADEARPEPREPPAAPRQAREADGKQPEWQQKRAEQDRAAMDVDGPEHRKAAPTEERSERPRDGAQLACP